jgi:ketol-acid reductoisomerase
MKDIVGFNYLLRVGENPQQAVFKQKTIIELVQRKGLEDFNQAISQYFKAMTLQQLQ